MSASEQPVTGVPICTRSGSVVVLPHALLIVHTYTPESDGCTPEMISLFSGSPSTNTCPPPCEAPPGPLLTG